MAAPSRLPDRDLPNLDELLAQIDDARERLDRQFLAQADDALSTGSFEVLVIRHTSYEEDRAALERAREVLESRRAGVPG